MKHVLAAFALLLAGTAATAPSAHAQTSAAARIGYTDYEVLLANLPQMDSVQTILQREAQAADAGLQPQAQEFQSKVEEYQRRQQLLSADARRTREQELAGLQQALEQAQQAAQQRLAVRRAELMRPIYEALQSAIDAEGAARNLDIVLPTQVGGQPVLLYVNQSRVVDITREVARRLGLNVEDGPAPTGN